MNLDAGCPFCLENHLLVCEVLYEDELWYFASAEPGSINNAGMAITKRHVATPFEINQEEWMQLHALLPTFKALLDTDNPQGYNLGWNVHTKVRQTGDRIRGSGNMTSANKTKRRPQRRAH